jgi:hypothetical protein
MLSAKTAELRNAVSAGAFAQAEELLAEYRQEVETAWMASASAQERQALAVEVNAVLKWAQATTHSARSHAQRKLILLNRESAYGPSMQRNELLDLDA